MPTDKSSAMKTLDIITKTTFGYKIWTDKSVLLDIEPIKINWFFVIIVLLLWTLAIIISPVEYKIFLLVLALILMR